MFLLVRVLCLSLSCGLVLGAAPTYEGGCGGVYTGDKGTFESPRWPRTYPNRRRCVYEIRAPPESTIALQFPTFHLQPRQRNRRTSPGLCLDWLKLYDGDNLIGGPFCGKEISPDRVFTSETSKITMVFKSNRRRVFPGFKATYSTYLNPPALQPTEDDVDNITPAYTFNKCGRPVVPRTPWTRPSTGNKIVGGNTAAPGSYPWQVGLTHPGGDYNIFCGGALLNENWVVTAAHCVDGLGQKDFWVVVGEHDINRIELKDVVEVQKTIIHSSYLSSTNDNDIALLELKSPVSLNDHVLSICLPEKGSVTPAGTIVTVTGWGSTSVFGATTPVLLQADMPVVSNSVCDSLYGPGTITSSMMCTGYDAGGVDSCHGDGGGPVVVFPSEGPAYLVGLVSFGSGCGRPGYPSVNSRVSAFVNWIQATMDKNP